MDKEKLTLKQPFLAVVPIFHKIQVWLFIPSLYPATHASNKQIVCLAKVVNFLGPEVNYTIKNQMIVEINHFKIV